MEAAPKLDLSALRWIVETVTQHQPDQFKLPFALWLIKSHTALIHEKLGTSSVHRLLQQLGSSAQVPLWRAWQPDETSPERLTLDKEVRNQRCGVKYTLSE